MNYILLVYFIHHFFLLICNRRCEKSTKSTHTPAYALPLTLSFVINETPTNMDKGNKKENPVSSILFVEIEYTIHPKQHRIQIHASSEYEMFCCKNLKEQKKFGHRSTPTHMYGFNVILVVNLAGVRVCVFFFFFLSLDYFSFLHFVCLFNSCDELFGDFLSAIIST